MIALVLLIPVMVCIVLYLVIDWEGVMRRWVGNNPNKGRVYIKVGKEYLPVKAKRVYMSEDGDVYKYVFGDMDLVVNVPFGYPLEFVEGKRIIFVEDGSSIASPFALAKSVNAGGVCDVSAVTQGQVVVELVKALTEKKGFPWKWLLIIGGVALVAFLIFNQFQGGEEPKPEEGWVPGPEEQTVPPGWEMD